MEPGESDLRVNTPFSNRKSQCIRSLGLEAIYVTVGQAISLLGSIASVTIIARFLEPDEYGKLALGLTLSSLIQLLGFSSISGAVLRLTSSALESGSLRGLIYACYQYLSIAFFGLCMVVFLAGLTLSALTRFEWIALVVAASLFGFLSGCCLLIENLHNALQQRFVMAIEQAFSPWIRLLGAILLLRSFSTSASAAVLGFAFGSAITLVLQVLVANRINSFHVYRGVSKVSPGDRALWRDRIWKYAWPIFCMAIFTWIQLAADRWALKSFAQEAEVGYFAILYQLGFAPMVLISTVITKFSAPLVFKQAGEATDAHRLQTARDWNRRAVLLTGVAGVCCSIVAALVHERLFSFLLSNPYIEVSNMLPLLVLAGGLFGCGQALTMNQLSELKTRKLIIPKIGAALIGVTSSIVGAYFFGLHGVVWGDVLSCAIYFMWMLLLSRGRIEVP